MTAARQGRDGTVEMMDRISTADEAGRQQMKNLFHLIMTMLAFACRAPLMVFLGTVPGAPGSQNYTVDGDGNGAIAWLFSNKTNLKFYDASIMTNVTNSDFSGEIEKEGDRVTIQNVPTVTVYKKQKNGTTQWQNLKADGVTMYVNRAIEFAFRMDNIDIKQFKNKAYMDLCAADAAEQQKIFIDTEFLGEVYADAPAENKGATAGKRSGKYNAGATGAPVTISKTNVLDRIAYMSGIGKEQNWPAGEWWMVIPTWMSVLLEVSDLKDASMTGGGSTLINGRLGKFGKFTLYETNLYTPVTDVAAGNLDCYNVVFGHKSAICAASQLTETDYFPKFENTSGKGMRGQQVYDWKTVKPEALGVLYCTPNFE